MWSSTPAFLILATVGLSISSPLGFLWSRAPDSDAIGPDDNPDLAGAIWEALPDNTNNGNQQPNAADSSVTHDGNSTTYLSLTFPDDEDDGPGVTINIDQTLRGDTVIGPYTFGNGSQSDGATIQDIFNDYSGVSRREAPTRLKNAVLDLIDDMEDLFASDNIQCGWDNGPNRQLLQNRDPGHLSVAIGHGIAGFGWAAGMAYVNAAKNLTDTEKWLIPGITTLVGIEIGRIFDSLQRRGVMNAPDAALGAVGVSALAAIKNGIRHLGAGIMAACASEDELRQWSTWAANPDIENQIENRPDIPWTSWQNAILGRNRNPADGGL